jgi:hypothetical protein
MRGQLFLSAVLGIAMLLGGRTVEAEGVPGAALETQASAECEGQGVKAHISCRMGPGPDLEPLHKTFEKKLGVLDGQGVLRFSFEERWDWPGTNKLNAWLGFSQGVATCDGVESNEVDFWLFEGRGNSNRARLQATAFTSGPSPHPLPYGTGFSVYTHSPSDLPIGGVPPNTSYSCQFTFSAE